MALLQKMPKQTDFNNIHKSTLQVEPAFELIHSETQKIKTSLDVQSTDLKPDIDLNLNSLKVTDGFETQQFKAKEKLENEFGEL